jgi:hypothetical protein
MTHKAICLYKVYLYDYVLCAQLIATVVRVSGYCIKDKIIEIMKRIRSDLMADEASSVFSTVSKAVIYTWDDDLCSKILTHQTFLTDRYIFHFITNNVNAYLVAITIATCSQRKSLNITLQTLLLFLRRYCS